MAGKVKMLVTPKKETKYYSFGEPRKSAVDYIALKAGVADRVAGFLFDAAKHYAKLADAEPEIKTKTEYISPAALCANEAHRLYEIFKSLGKGSVVIYTHEEAANGEAH